MWYTEDAGTTWSEHTYQGVTHQSENVVGRISGSASPDTVVILGAHYDSIVWDRPMDYAPGADDNASGVAALIELARILSQADLKYSVEFVAFSTEEVGTAGSRHYAKLLRRKRQECKSDDQFRHDRICGNTGMESLLWSNDDSRWLVDLASDMAFTYTDVIPEKNSMNSFRVTGNGFWIEVSRHFW